MGVITIAYSVEPKMMKKVRADNENLAFIFGDCEDESEIWKVESYDFDKGIDVYIDIFREAGYTKTAKNIDSGNQGLDDFDFGGYDVWVVPPSGVKAMVKELENATFEVLKAKVMSDQVKDRRGNVLGESLLESYVGDIEGIKEFFDKAFEDQNYILFAEA